MQAIFDSGSNAIECALAIHDDLARVFGPGQAIHLRIGIAEGPILEIVKEDRLHVSGMTANLAARICGLADAGGIVVTESVAIGVEDVQFKDLGAVPLKGVGVPVRLLELMR